ncbi:hypothetical protein COU79_00200 [Candidatus Peregrinibacteria bacterium CG10_big_fil_rev_8_21_14_0_10_54_7]|nr:MAG: hypothetical protein COU79_00200 [Candidatus Peregrinibacteria bacterium CG10_big_fil_rev_8_21_14_0_10_54_7]
MTKYHKRPLTPQEAKRFFKPFPITSVCRADLVETVKLTEKETLKICDGDMEEIAEKMAEAYCDSGFWIDLPIIAEHVLGERGA